MTTFTPSYSLPLSHYLLSKEFIIKGWGGKGANQVDSAVVIKLLVLHSSARVFREFTDAEIALNQLDGIGFI
jgi:hypothetical protein